MSDWKEEDHPRVPAGEPGGGQFTDGGSSGRPVEGRTKVQSKEPITLIRARDERKSAIRDVERGVNMMPQEHADFVRDVPIAVSDTIYSESMKSLAGTSGAGYAAGMYYHTPPHIEVAQYYGTIDPNAGMFKISGLDTVVLHEIGHAIDHKTGWQLGMRIQPAFDQEFARLSPSEKQNATYWNRNSKEKYAELYALTYHKDRPDSRGRTFFGGMSRARARQAFKGSIAVMQTETDRVIRDRSMVTARIASRGG